MSDEDEPRRGRPRLQMTHRRKQVLAEYERVAKAGGPIRLAELARRCGLYDYRKARRVVADLRSMGAI